METSFYKNSQAVHLAIHLLLEANHKAHKISFNNAETTIARGQVLTGRLTLSKETGIKPSSVRNLLHLLSKLGFLDIKSNNKFSIITIHKYEHYQDVSLWLGHQKGQPEDNQRTTKGQPEDTPKECNNDKNVKNDNNIIKTIALNDEKKHRSAPPKISFSFEKGIFENVSELFLTKWQSAFPAVDAQYQLEKMACWLLTHPQNRKSNYAKFINNWLSKAQDQAGPRPDSLEPQKKVYTEKEISDMRRWRDKGFPKTYWQGLEEIENVKRSNS